MTETAPVWAVIAGGGTAGHVLPGLTIAEEIVERGTPRQAVHWVGSQRGIENRLVPEAGFHLTSLPGRGLRRRVTFANATAAAGLARAFVQSWRLLGRDRPAVVIGLGGYASAACGAAAALRRVPLVITEQNAVAGAANRFLSRFATAAAVAFPATDLARPHCTGNPVRPEMSAIDRGRAEDRASARAALKVTGNRRMVAVFGGSLGARSINEAVVQAVTSPAPRGWKDRADLCIRHISGHRDHAEMSARVSARTTDDSTGESTDDLLAYDLLAYEDDMASVYAAADVVVCRAGATSVAELAAAGVPGVLVPLPGAPADHQTANARAMVDAGAAVMVADAELDGARLVSEVESLLGDSGRLETMSRACATVSRPGAAQAVVDLVEACANRQRPAADS